MKSLLSNRKPPLQRERGIRKGPARKQGLQPNLLSRLMLENEQLKQQNQRLSKRLGEAAVISEFQKKLAEALEVLVRSTN